MANDENKIILEFPATNVEIEFGETITFDNISGFLDSGRVTYNGESLTEEIAHLEDSKADQTYVDTELGKKADKSNTYTKSEVDTLIDNLPEPMIFKGTLGVGGTIESLPTASAENEGWTFKCITAGTYAGLDLKVGDSVTCFNPPNTSVYEWDISGHGDTDTDTWRAIKVNGTEELGSGISSGSVDFVGSENIDVEFDSNGNKIGVKTKNIYTKSEVDDIVYGILPDDTASGSVANFETDLALPIKSLEIDVNAKQDLHGYDYPWTAGGGKNLLPFENVLTEGWSRTNSGITAEYSNGIMHVYGTNELNAWNNIVVFNDIWRNSEIRLPAGTYSIPDHLVVRISEDNIGYSNKGGTVIYNNPIYVRGFYISVPANYTVDWHVPMMFVYGSVIPTTYEPYSNICPITGHTEANIVRTGKNLFNKTNFQNLVTNYETVVNSYKIKRIKLKPNTTYTISQNSREAQSTPILLLHNIPTVNERGYFDCRKASETKTYTTDETGCLYIGVIGNNDAVVNERIEACNIQIELGSTATDYEPYAGTEVTVQFGQTVYKGVLDAKNSKVIATHVLGIFDGSNDETWNDYPTGNGFFVSGLSNHIKESYGDGLCNILPTSKSISKLGVVYGINSQYIFIMQVKTAWNISTVSDLRTFLASNPLQIMYKLAEPIEIPLSAISQFTTLIGTNNIYADTGDTSVVFKDSVNGYVEKKIASVQALILNG